MTGKTHMAIGVGTSTVLLHTSDIKTMICGTALAIVSSLIVDVDTDKSEGSKFLKNIVGASIILIVLGLILKENCNINIFNHIIQNN